MSFVLAGFCAVNCWVIPKLWEPIYVRRVLTAPHPPGRGILVRMRGVQREPLSTKAPPALLLAA